MPSDRPAIAPPAPPAGPRSATAEPPISAAEPGAGATPSATCSRCRPSIRRGSTPCPTTSRKAPPPRPFRQSASSISASSRRSSRPAASAAIEPPADTAIPDHPHPPAPHRTPTPGLTRVGAQAPPTPFAPRNAEGAALGVPSRELPRVFADCRADHGKQRARGPQGDEQGKDRMTKQLRHDLERGGMAGAPRIEWASIATIRPDPKNSRTHSRKQLRQIAASIRKFGFLNPLIVDDGDMILAGHGRLEAARLEGMAHVPIIRFDHLSEAQKRAYV